MTQNSNMSAHHHHGHSHAPVRFDKINKAFYIGIALNLCFAVIEAICGYFYDSLALLTDAGHNLSDVMSLVLSMIAFKLMQKLPTPKFTYGYKKTTILASLINAVSLLVVVVIIAYEAVQRFNNPQELPGIMVAIVAFIGIIINGLTAFLFLKEKDTDINVKGAYLHMVADALVSLGVVVGGILMYFTHWYWVDSILSIIIAIVIFMGSWGLFKESWVLSIDGVPKGIDVKKVEEEILSIAEVESIKDMRIWAISTIENAFSAKIKLKQNHTLEELNVIRKKMEHELEHYNIQTSTIEFH